MNKYVIQIKRFAIYSSLTILLLLINYLLLYPFLTWIIWKIIGAFNDGLLLLTYFIGTSYLMCKLALKIGPMIEQLDFSKEKAKRINPLKIGAVVLLAAVAAPFALQIARSISRLFWTRHPEVFAGLILFLIELLVVSLSYFLPGILIKNRR